eukprot:16427112-Heterocapsa_arctica.AAC.1
MCQACHPIGAARSHYHKAWACPTTGNPPGCVTSSLSHSNMPAPSRSGSRADVMMAITVAWDEARRAQEAAG